MERIVSGIKDTDECIEWNGACHKNTGYGYICLSKMAAEELGLYAVQSTHRLSYIIHKGPIEKGNVIRHLCNNRKCYNPKHLVQGTQLENYEDGVKAGTNRRKLTKEDVEEIRSSSESNRKLGKKFGVSSTTIFHIKHGNKWRN